MAGWEEELALLLRALGVTLEQSKTQIRPAQAHENEYRKQMPMPARRKDTPQKQAQFIDVRLWRTPGDELAEDDAAWMNDLSLMRRQVEFIVGQVVRLMQSEDVDPALKEDVTIVLHALRRRASATEQAAASETAYLESASALLHFCRLVLRLGEVTPEEM
jgi:hypothetical protein